MTEHPLDRPVWSALNGGWKAVSSGDGTVRRLDPAYGPFGASADASPGALEALAGITQGRTGCGSWRPRIFRFRRALMSWVLARG